MNYLLDSNVVVGLLKRNHRIGESLRKREVGSVFIPAIVMHELYFGAFKSRHRALNIHHLGQIELPVLDFNDADARSAGHVRWRLSTKGMPIGPHDTLIAGQALSRAMTLVTHNTREFERVESLLMEDWEA